MRHFYFWHQQIRATIARYVLRFRRLVECVFFSFGEKFDAFRIELFCFPAPIAHSLCSVRKNKSNELEQIRVENPSSVSCLVDICIGISGRTPGLLFWIIQISFLRSFVHSSSIRFYVLHVSARFSPFLFSFSSSSVPRSVHTYKINFPSSLLDDLYRGLQNAFETCTFANFYFEFHQVKFSIWWNRYFGFIWNTCTYVCSSAQVDEKHWAFILLEFIQMCIWCCCCRWWWCWECVCALLPNKYALMCAYVIEREEKGTHK